MACPGAGKGGGGAMRVGEAGGYVARSRTNPTGSRAVADAAASNLASSTASKKRFQNPVSSGISKTALQDANAQMTREMFDYTNNTFKPLEHELKEYMEDDSVYREGEQAAFNAADNSYDVQKGIRDRNLSSRNMQLTNDQRQLMDKNLRRKSQLSGIDGAIKANRSTGDRKRAIRGSLIDNGMSTVNKALSQGSQLSQMEASRNSRNDASKSGFQSQLLGTAMTGAMLLSSEEAKENIKDHDPKKSHKDIMSTNLKSFDYKPEYDIPGRKIGGLAEELPKSMKAAGGKAQDVQNTLNNLVGGIQHLTSEIEKMKGKA